MKPELHLPQPFCCAQVLPPGAMSLQELLEEDDEAGDEGGPSYAETCKQGQHLSNHKYALLSLHCINAQNNVAQRCCTADTATGVTCLNWQFSISSSKVGKSPYVLLQHIHKFQIRATLLL